MGATALIGLGSNLGDRKGSLDAAVAALVAVDGVQVRAVSSHHETRPVGGPDDQGAFLNAAVALESALNPFELHCTLRAIEQRAGRVRAVRWGARTLDLDLLLFGEQIIDTAELTVPHRRMAMRRFVLAPMAEIAPEAVDPLTGRTIAELLANLDRRPCYMALDLPRNQGRKLFRSLVAKLMAAGLCEGSYPILSIPHSFSWQVRKQLFARFLGEKTLELRSDRWSTEIWGDRWLVTEYWLDRLFLSLVGADELTRLVGVRESFLEHRMRTIQPTFVVAPRLAPGRLTAWAEEMRPNRPIGSDVPILRPEATDSEGVLAEVLAACSACRG